MSQIDQPAAVSVPPTMPIADVSAGRSWSGVLRLLFVVAVLVLAERTFFFQPYAIPSGSMQDTLAVGDVVLVEKFSYGYGRYAFPWGTSLPSFAPVLALPPVRGDVAVFALPSDPQRMFIKRVIGLPGDRVQVVHGVVYLNGRPVPKVRLGDAVEHHGSVDVPIARYRETLPNGRSYNVLERDADGRHDNTPVYTVPPGRYFVLGDNRDDSDDSRGIVGYVPAANLVGRAEFVVFSINDQKNRNWTFWKWSSAVRWRRFFRSID
jgi:signal peptidase I